MNCFSPLRNTVTKLLWGTISQPIECLPHGCSCHGLKFCDIKNFLKIKQTVGGNKSKYKMGCVSQPMTYSSRIHMGAAPSTDKCLAVHIKSYITKDTWILEKYISRFADINTEPWKLPWKCLRIIANELIPT